MICYWVFLKLYHDSLVKIVGYLYMYYTTQINYLYYWKSAISITYEGRSKSTLKLTPLPSPANKVWGYMYIHVGIILFVCLLVYAIMSGLYFPFGLILNYITSHKISRRVGQVQGHWKKMVNSLHSNREILELLFATVFHCISLYL